MSTIFDVPGRNPPNPFVSDIETFLASARDDAAAGKTASRLVSAVTASSDPKKILWMFWDAFFISVATFSSSHITHQALLEAIQAQQATTPINPGTKSDGGRRHSRGVGDDGKFHWQELPNFGRQWRDVHDTLEAWRDWDGIWDSDKGNISSLKNSPGGYYLQFCIFSAALLKAGIQKGASPSIWVFYACRNVLEYRGPRPGHQRPHRISSQQLWDLDVRVTADVDSGELRLEWADTLDEPTDLWPRKEGLTWESWLLWRDRLQDLAKDAENLGEKTRVIAADAVAVVNKLFGDK
ncbi:hypothetical protein QQS21_012686 [Conoideocrella luteorostrata]|uniref:Uncharacterized protein n=1 Tax=Conoideocrella luteorostrata TaxID=1105319 RepID=A0AAJ0CB15_9HYPO|nr:hypothetical protein QQS21_012686 [Conoideocrella luteorostrata]